MRNTTTISLIEQLGEPQLIKDLRRGWLKTLCVCGHTLERHISRNSNTELGACYGDTELCPCGEFDESAIQDIPS